MPPQAAASTTPTVFTLGATNVTEPRQYPACRAPLMTQNTSRDPHPAQRNFSSISGTSPKPSAIRRASQRSRRAGRHRGRVRPPRLAQRLRRGGRFGAGQSDGAERRAHAANMVTPRPTSALSRAFRAMKTVRGRAGFRYARPSAVMDRRFGAALVRKILRAIFARGPGAGRRPACDLR